MPGTPTFISGVEMIADNSDSDAESTASSSSGEQSLNGGIIRKGSNVSASTQSRTGSMRSRPAVKKIPKADSEDECSPEDIREAKEELAKAGAVANLHSLKLGLQRDLIKDLLMGNGTNLKELVLSSNQIASLPHNIFDRLQNLEKLDLTNNKLTMIPMSAMTLPKLQILLLDHNHITCIPDTYDIADPLCLPALHTIGLEWNRLTEFPAHLFGIADRLRKIYICENLGIKSLPPLNAFPFHGEKIDLRLDNRPTLLDQFHRGGYDARINADWNKIYPDKVMDFVYLGSLRTAQCNEVYKDLDIKYVLTAGRNLDVFLPEGMIQLELPLDDVPGENISLFFKDAFHFIDSAIKEQKGVLLHCFAGLSRSVTVMVAYLMKTRYPLSMEDALTLVKQARPNSHPNEGFIRSLKAFEGQLASESR
jgi:protein-tyrosine phosphatase/Leucine-rich repeat (LRR) protein